MIAPLAIVSAAAGVALMILGVAFLLAGWRLVVGPTLPDRILALDTLSGTAIGFIAVLAVKTGFSLYIDIAISLGLVGFLATVAFARFVMSRSIVAERHSEKTAGASKKPKVAAKRSRAKERKGKP
ncbi:MULTISPECIES: cation:proton antiporter [Rhizobium]|uniref:PhaF2 protein n=1 Tax=Rhizobium favelukesii TaxID=348824 RepID=W6RR71_9HYPH|nr:MULTISPECIES: cation:proton antiporter [Rhizobium]MCA0801050.1 cation:proton antiporter [Rhizobium sp. T1473]MCS0458586.1 cation:proton antiporter [Rhizobium favelukesii]UFS81395.1 cation:proton antiporter [Rhizobium sp. T136]CDM56906.1 PhaF2 protein [Rhizobium favelukesii]